MATCHSCGSELSGSYCSICGARSMEERAKPKPPPKPAPRKAQPRAPGALSQSRIWKTTAVGVLGLALFGAGLVTGFWLAGGGGSLSSTAIDAAGSPEGLPPVALGGKFMEEGAAYLQQGQRSAAGNSFRKAIEQYQLALRENPNDLYAQTFLGLTYYYAGDPGKGIETQNQVLQKDPAYLWALFNMAWMLETGGKKAEAASAYTKYLEVVPQERQNILKYMEQAELIDRQEAAARKALEGLMQGGSAK